MNGEQGFSLIEIMLGMAIFMVGMLGVALLQVSAMKNDAFASNLAEASTLASGKLEELMGLDYEDASLSDDGDGTNQDANNNGVDDDEEGAVADGVNNFGLDDKTAVQADGHTLVTLQTMIYEVLWNIANDKPVLNSKTIKVWVTWNVKGFQHSVSLTGILAKEV